MLDICLLGTGGTMPLPNRWLTAAIVSYNGKMLLIDCGEGTQILLKKLGWGFKDIEAICLTHYHGDHVLGLPGLFLTIGNSGRTAPLTIMGPPGIAEIISGLTVVAQNLPFEIVLMEVFSGNQIKIGDCYVNIIGVEHNMPCLAYAIEIKRGRKFNPQRAKELNIPMPLWGHLQNGEEIIYEGRTLDPEMVLGPPRKGLKVCYCTDTRPVPDLVDFIDGADLFICEGMYAEEEKLPKAVEKKHMLFSEAASLAKAGNVSELWLTHYSPSLTNPEDFIEETRKIFKNTFIGKDGVMKTLVFEKR